jgi:hypothetical protein
MVLPQKVHHLLIGEIYVPLDLELLLHQPHVIWLILLLPEASLEVEVIG